MTNEEIARFFNTTRQHSYVSAQVRKEQGDD
jgi:hypothetical protein